MIKIANHKTGGRTQQKMYNISQCFSEQERGGVLPLKSNSVAFPVTDNYSVMEFEWRQH